MTLAGPLHPAHAMKRLSPAKLRRHLDRLEQSLPAALVRRFAEADLMTQAASLSFYTLLSLAPLLVLLLWLTASLYPPAQASLVAQIGDLAGPSAEAVAATVIRNADAQPDIGSLAGVWSLALLFVGATVVFAQLRTTVSSMRAATHCPTTSIAQSMTIPPASANCADKDQLRQRFRIVTMTRF